MYLLAWNSIYACIWLFIYNMLSIKHVTMDTYHGNHATCDRVPLQHKIFSRKKIFNVFLEFCKNLPWNLFTQNYWQDLVIFILPGDSTGGSHSEHTTNIRTWVRHNYYVYNKESQSSETVTNYMHNCSFKVECLYSSLCFQLAVSWRAYFIHPNICLHRRTE